jgi:hypothetical protein
MMSWPCRYDKCKKMIDGEKNLPYRKYCDFHQKVREKERRKKMNDKRQQNRLIIKMATRQCGICHTPLGLYRSKWCSPACADEGARNKRKRKNMQRSIEYHTNCIQKIMEKMS